MIFLALSILSSASIYVIFKLVDRFKVFTLSAIVVNYLAACLAGFFLSNSSQFTPSIFRESWFPISVIIGVMFIVMFYLIAKSTQRAGVAVTTVAVKMSVVFPIAFSIWYDADDNLSLLKLSGIVIALIAVYLTVYRKSTSNVDTRTILLPAAIFLGMGVVDSFVKFAQSAYVSNDIASLFSATVFAVSLFTGVIVLFFNSKASKGLLNIKTWILGVLLGLVNFGSIYFLLLALNHIDVRTGVQAMGSVIFGINNIGIVALSVVIGFLIFAERPKLINWFGIALSIFAIFILSVS